MITVEQTAARAAMAVPGVQELQPSLRHSLADAATHIRRTFGSRAPSPEAGIHAGHTPETDTWHLEVRCAVNDHRRALDIARAVREGVQAAVSSHLSDCGWAARVTVIVTVTRICGDQAPLHMNADLKNEDRSPG